jgi:predicted amidophosphoribosyltransferase
MSEHVTREVRRRRGAPMSAKSSGTKTKYCSVCGEPASDIICDRCKAKIQGEAVNKKQQVERELKTDTSRK